LGTVSIILHLKGHVVRPPAEHTLVEIQHAESVLGMMQDVSYAQIGVDETVDNLALSEPVSLSGHVIGVVLEERQVLAASLLQDGFQRL